MPEEKWTDTEFFKMMECIAADDVQGLMKAQESYGDSWKRRGGIGAFMMMARKWDRLELQVKKELYNIFNAIMSDTRSEGIIDDIRDLRRYLFLVETLMCMTGVISIGTHRDSSKDDTESRVDALNEIADKNAVLARVPVWTHPHQLFYFKCEKQPPQTAEIPTLRKEQFHEGWQWIHKDHTKPNWPDMHEAIESPYSPGATVVSSGPVYESSKPYIVTDELAPLKIDGEWFFCYAGIQKQVPLIDGKVEGPLS